MRFVLKPCPTRDSSSYTSHGHPSIPRAWDEQHTSHLAAPCTAINLPTCGIGVNKTVKRTVHVLAIPFQYAIFSSTLGELTKPTMDIIPITRLNPTTAPPADRAIRAIITLSWPYSSSTQQCALLLADPDFRQRNRQGQVRVQFTGPSAEAVARSKAGIGDEVVLELGGAVWVDEPGARVNTPGKSVDGELVFKRRLRLTLKREGSEQSDILLDVDEPTPPPDYSRRYPGVDHEMFTPPKAPTAYRSSLGGAGAMPIYSSPAFVKRLRLSGENFLVSAYDESLDLDGLGERPRKKPRISFGNVKSWRFADRTPSPVSDEFSDLEVEEEEEVQNQRHPGQTLGFNGPAPGNLAIVTEQSPILAAGMQTTENAVLARDFQSSHTEIPMAPPPLAPLQIPTDTPLPGSEQSMRLPAGQTDRPTTPKLQPVPTSALPVPSPFPNDSVQQQFGDRNDFFALQNAPFEQIPSYAIQSALHENERATHQPFRGELYDSKQPDHIPSTQDSRYKLLHPNEDEAFYMKSEPNMYENDDQNYVRHTESNEYLSDTEEDEEMYANHFAQRHTGTGNTDAIVPVNDKNESAREEVEQVQSPTSPHSSGMHEEPEDDSQTPAKLPSGSFAFDSVSESSPQQPKSTPQSEKAMVMASTYRSLFGFPGSASQNEQLREKERFASTELTEVQLDGPPTAAAVLPLAGLDSVAQGYVFEISPSKESHLTEMPIQSSPQFGHPSMSQFINFGSSSDAEEEPQDQHSQPFDEVASQAQHTVSPENDAKIENESTQAQSNHSASSQAIVPTKRSPVNVFEIGDDTPDRKTETSVHDFGHEKFTEQDFEQESALVHTPDERELQSTFSSETVVLDQVPDASDLSFQQPQQPKEARASNLLEADAEALLNDRHDILEVEQGHSVIEFSRFSEAKPPSKDSDDEVKKTAVGTKDQDLFTLDGHVDRVEPNLEFGAQQSMNRDNEAVIEINGKTSDQLTGQQISRPDENQSLYHLLPPSPEDSQSHAQQHSSEGSAREGWRRMLPPTPQLTQLESMVDSQRSEIESAEPDAGAQLLEGDPLAEDYKPTTVTEISTRRSHRASRPNNEPPTSETTERTSTTAKEVHVKPSMGSKPPADPAANQLEGELAQVFSVPKRRSSRLHPEEGTSEKVSEVEMTQTKPIPTAKESPRTLRGRPAPMEKVPEDDQAAHPPRPPKETPVRKSLNSRRSQVPDVISAWFSPRRSTRQHPEPQHAIEEEVKVLPASGKSSDGIATTFSYYTPLSKIAEKLNSSSQSYGGNTVDVVAVVTNETQAPERAKAGPKDYHTVFRITDPSLARESSVRVEVFRPWHAKLPVAQVGDGVLLRSFAVKSRKRQPYLLSTDASAWCIWRYDEEGDEKENVEKPAWARRHRTSSFFGVREEVKGPPVELGEEERQRAVELRGWWQGLHE